MWIKCVFAPKFLVYRLEIKGFINELILILAQKNKFLSKTLHRLSIADVKILLLTRKIGKAYKVRNFYCLLDRRNSRHFFKLRTWRTAKTCVFPLGMYESVTCQTIRKLKNFTQRYENEIKTRNAWNREN